MKETFRIIEKYEGDTTIVKDNLSTFDEVKQALIISSNLYDWILENDPEYDLPNFKEYEGWQSLGYELEKRNISMSYWHIVIEKLVNDEWEAINPRYKYGWYGYNG